MKGSKEDFTDIKIHECSLQDKEHTGPKQKEVTSGKRGAAAWRGLRMRHCLENHLQADMTSYSQTYTDITKI